MPVVLASKARPHEAPIGVTSTLASPTLGGAGLAMWRAMMVAGAQGPEHTFDVEHVWTVLRGGAEVELDGETRTVVAGDTLVLPPGVIRRVTATDSGFEALCVTSAGARALLPDGTDKGVPPWIV